ncbi:MAG: hypothetical protein JXA18_03650, partial [Chitinispirillaceae bacterium]|nr:hypothetical protein [Chitinispirillaceae bacterium]
MIRKLLFFPFWLLSGSVKMVVKLLGVLFSAGSGAVRLVINRLFGVVFGALIGFFLGKGHIGIRLFKK